MNFTPNLNNIPFEIIVIIAETCHEVWYLLSITLRTFGLYSTQPNIKRNAMKQFGFEQIFESNHQGYLFHGQYHGLVIEKGETKGNRWVEKTRYNRGKKHGIYQFFNKDLLILQCTYFNNERHGKELNYDKKGRKQSLYIWHRDQIVESHHICKKCRRFDFDFISCDHPNAIFEIDDDLWIL